MQFDFKNNNVIADLLKICQKYVVLDALGPEVINSGPLGKREGWSKGHAYRARNERQSHPSQSHPGNVSRQGLLQDLVAAKAMRQPAKAFVKIF